MPNLQTLYDLFADSAESIPPMLLAERQLQTIVEAWDELEEYGTYLSPFAYMSCHVMVCGLEWTCAADAVGCFLQLGDMLKTLL